MATRKITRKVITPLRPVKEEPQEQIVSEPEEEPKAGRIKKECFFCQTKLRPSYTDLANLRRFLTDRAKIVARERSGVCSRHQREIARNIKYARHLALLPFVRKV